MKYNNYYTDYELYARILAQLLTQMKFSNNTNIKKQFYFYRNIVYYTFKPQLVDGIFKYAQQLHRIDMYNEESLPKFCSAAFTRSFSLP
jgi:hypothetical protein